MKKKLILAAFLLFAALPTKAAISLVQHTNKNCGSGASCALAYSSSPGVNNLLIVVARGGGGTGTTSFTVADTIVNSWTQLTRVDDGTNGTSIGWYVCANASNSAETVTVSISPNATIRMAIYEYSGAATSSCLDVQNTGSGTGTAVASTSITPGAANELVLAWGEFNQVETVTVGTNFTLEDQVPAAPNTRMAAEDWIQTTATATTGPMTIGTSTSWTSNVAAFKPAGGAAAPGGMNKRQKLEQIDPQTRHKLPTSKVQA
jgi:hypothetical protein